MRLIDADALIYGLRDYTFTLNPDDPNATKEYRLVSKMIEILENAPTIEPQRKKGKWINCDGGIATCSVCGDRWGVYGVMNFCPNCGAEMRDSVETARDIVHEAIDNSVWSDTVDTAKMHKIVDDKYAEIRGDANADANT